MSNRPFQEPYSVGRCAHCAPVRNFHAMASITCVKNVGTLLWGARTLSDSDDWRYIPIRRLFSTVERDLRRALTSAVFEPNTQPPWEQVREAAGH